MIAGPLWLWLGLPLALITGWWLGRRQRGAVTAQDTQATTSTSLPPLPHVALLETDSEGRITACNPGAEQVLGRSRERLLQQPVQELFESVRPAQDLLAAANPPGQLPDAQDWICVRSDGSRRQISLSISSRPWQSGYLLAGIDVTRERTSVDTLRFSERLVNSAFDVSSQGLSIINAKGRLIRVNTALTHLLGCSRHDLLTRDLQSFVSDEERDPLLQALRAAVSGQLPGFQLETQLCHKSGRRIPVLLNGTRVLLSDKDADTLVVHVFDLSERLAHDQAQADEARLRESILSNIVDAIITIDESGLITSFNPAASRMFQWPAEDVLGQNIKRLMPEPYRSEHDGYLRRHLTQADAPISRRARKVQGLRRNGEVFDLELSLSELVLGDQRRFIGVLRDITEQRRIERLKDELVSVVSHELRTPLTTIYGALSLMHSRALGEMPDTVHELVQASLQNAERMKHLIDDLLDMDKLAAGKMAFYLEAVELAKLLRQAVQLMRADSDRKQLQVHMEAPRQVVRVMADPKRLEQVVINLLSNAIKFSEAGQSIRIQLSVAEAMARVSVIDQGPGIPAAAIDKLFTRFSMAHSAADSHRGGTGLGLAISKAIIDQLQGEIGVHSVVNEGSEFYFTLPLLPREAQDHQG